MEIKKWIHLKCFKIFFSTFSTEFVFFHFSTALIKTRLFLGKGGGRNVISCPQRD